MSSFIGDYARRDRTVAFPDWLESRLRQELPGEASEQLVGEILAAVAGYDRTLDELNTAVAAGQSQEEWFAGRMAEGYAGLPADTAGERLQGMEDGLNASNLQLMQELDETRQLELPGTEEAPVGWNKYSLKENAYGIGKKLSLAGVGIAANVMKRNLEGDGLRDAVGEALRDGMKTEPGEVKAAVAGAVKVAAVKGLAKALPADTPTEFICDMAGAAVEGAEALFDAANGDSTMTEALDKVGRAGVAAGCRYGSGALKGYLLTLPFGPVIVDLAGGLLDHLAGPKFAENVYRTVHDLAVDTWEGIKESGKRMLNGLKQLFAN